MVKPLSSIHYLCILWLSKKSENLHINPQWKISFPTVIKFSLYSRLKAHHYKQRTKRSRHAGSREHHANPPKIQKEEKTPSKQLSPFSEKAIFYSIFFLQIELNFLTSYKNVRNGKYNDNEKIKLLPINELAQSLCATKQQKSRERKIG